RLSSRLSSRLPDGAANAIWLWLVLRVGLGILGILMVVSREVPTPCQTDIATNGWLTFPPLADGPLTGPLVGVWQHWDACWYSKIAAFGYEPGESSTAFFPLFPLLMRAGAVLVGGVATAGIIVSAIAFVIALTGLWQLIARDVDEATATRTQLYVAIFPVGFFFFAPFTESLFLACAVWAFLGARRGDWELAAVAGFLAALTRPQGILLALPIAWEVVRWWLARRRDPDHGPWRLREVMPLGAAAAPILGTLAYFVYTAVVAGRSFIDAQSTWSGGNLRWPWESIAAAWDRVQETGDVVTLLNLAGLLLFGGLILAGLRRLPLSYSLYVVPQLVLLAIRAPTWPLMSGARYLLVLFPCFVILALAGRNPRFHTAWVVISLLLLGFFATKFLGGSFV
ncbi:MAG: glycosyltransferase family 39 protein, partial [Chloroflexota bacterium]